MTYTKHEIMKLTKVTPKYEIGEVVYHLDNCKILGPFTVEGYDTCCSQRHSHEYTFYFLSDNTKYSYGEHCVFRSITEAEIQLQHDIELRQK